MLIDSAGPPEVIVIATGSEVGIAADAVRAATAKGRKVRLVSMPSTTTFDRQDQAYKDSVLPPSVEARVAIEQGAEFGWDRYVGLKGKTVTMASFGASAPLADLQKKFGFTVDNVVKVAREVMG